MICRHAVDSETNIPINGLFKGDVWSEVSSGSSSCASSPPKARPSSRLNFCFARNFSRLESSKPKNRVTLSDMEDLVIGKSQRGMVIGLIEMQCESHLLRLEIVSSVDVRSILL
jgi:hypothetical protein